MAPARQGGLDGRELTPEAMRAAEPRGVPTEMVVAPAAGVPEPG